MTKIHIPIRRILPEEIVEFLEWLMDCSDLDFTEEGIGRDHKLTLLTLDASMGKLTIAVSAEDRGLAALTQLKWGKDVDETQ